MDYTALAEELIAEELNAHPRAAWPRPPEESHRLTHLLTRMLRGVRGAVHDSRDVPPDTGRPAPPAYGFQPPAALMARTLPTLSPEGRAELAEALLVAVNRTPEYRRAYETGRLPNVGELAQEAWLSRLAGERPNAPSTAVSREAPGGLPERMTPASPHPDAVPAPRQRFTERTAGQLSRALGQSERMLEQRESLLRLRQERLDRTPHLPLPDTARENPEPWLAEQVDAQFASQARQSRMRSFSDRLSTVARNLLETLRQPDGGLGDDARGQQQRLDRIEERCHEVTAIEALQDELEEVSRKVLGEVLEEPALPRPLPHSLRRMDEVGDHAARTTGELASVSRALATDRTTPSDRTPPRTSAGTEDMSAAARLITSGASARGTRPATADTALPGPGTPSSAHTVSRGRG